MGVHESWTTRVVACAMWAVSPIGLWAQPSAALPDARPEARQALEVLLGSLAEGEAVVPSKAVSPSNPVVANTRQRTVVRTGETLDAVVRRTLSHLPIKDTVLRAAFVELNPTAFVNGSVHRLRAGSELVVPSPEDVRRLMLRDAGVSPAQVAPATAPAAATAQSSARADPETEPPDTRHWIRYP